MKKPVAHLRLQSLTQTAFADFGDIIGLKPEPDKIINQGRCGRHHDLARLSFEAGGTAGISLFKANPCKLPYRFEMMERHPKGSQAFIPMYQAPFLVIVAADTSGRPYQPVAFMVPEATGINIHKNIWHGVLTPLQSPGLFAVIDRIGGGENLEEYWFDKPYVVIP